MNMNNTMATPVNNKPNIAEMQGKIDVVLQDCVLRADNIRKAVCGMSHPAPDIKNPECMLDAVENMLNQVDCLASIINDIAQTLFGGVV